MCKIENGNTNAFQRCLEQLPNYRPEDNEIALTDSIGFLSNKNIKILLCTPKLNS